MNRRKCPNCKGTGKCPECNGKGEIINYVQTFGKALLTLGAPLFFGAEKDKCKVCNANGKCCRCHGKGHIPIDGNVISTTTKKNITVKKKIITKKAKK